jgi:small conductance mechanosensitive channel
MNLTGISQTALAIATQAGMKVLGALALWIVGRWLIRLAARLVSRGLEHEKLDATVVRYVRNTLTVVLNITLVVAILGYFGVQTTTFAAVLAAAGFAVGVAWSGLLANFAAGAFLVVLRPFKSGDLINAGGVLGTVVEVGLFVTTIDTLDNIRTFVGNNKLFSDNIQNLSANPYRRVDLVAQLAHTVDHRAAIGLLKSHLSRIPNVLNDPAPVVEILQFTAMGPVLAVRPFTNNANYWQVYFDTNRAIRETFGEAGYPAPEHIFAVRNEAGTGGISLAA